MRTIQALIVGSSIGLLLVGCGEPEVEVKAPVRPIKIHTIGSLSPTALREYPGTIRAFQTAEMGFEVAGRVTEFLVREGDVVEKDQELARLDSRDYDAQLKVADANLAKAQADLNRTMNIFKTDPGAISKDTIDRDERAVKVSEAELDITKKAVEDTVLRAPFAGLMARKLVEDFANVLAKQPVLVLQDNSMLEIEVSVPERDFVRTAKVENTKEEITKRVDPKIIVSSLPDNEFPGWIKEFATMADPVTRTFPVKLNFDNPEEFNVLPGMTARVRVVIDPKSAWSVPATAAQADEDGNSYVWKIDPDSMTVSQSPVELGPLTGDRVLLTSGVDKGDMVAISGVTALRDGLKVRNYEK